MKNDNFKRHNVKFVQLTDNSQAYKHLKIQLHYYAQNYKESIGDLIQLSRFIESLKSKTNRGISVQNFYLCLVYNIYKSSGGVFRHG